jgi:hypothetical protein
MAARASGLSPKVPMAPMIEPNETFHCRQLGRDWGDSFLLRVH